MIEGVFIVEGDISDLSEKVFRQLKEEAGGVPNGVKVKSNKICLNKKNDLLRSRVIFERS